MITTSSSTLTQPKLFVDILDYIFAFLNPKSLIACSKAHPFFSTIAERHLYHHIILADPFLFHPAGGPGHLVMPSYLIRRLSEAPQIVSHVRILQIELGVSEIHEEIALILPMLTSLERIALTSFLFGFSWDSRVSETLKVAVEACLRLPTLRGVYIGHVKFPLAMLDGNANIKTLWLSRSLQRADCLVDANHFLQLTSLVLEDTLYGNCIIAWGEAWAKQHITKLRSLRCGYGHVLWFLENCSDTLTDLDIELEVPYQFTNASQYLPIPGPSLDLSSLPHLQHFTIRMRMDHVDNSEYWEDPDDNGEDVQFYLPSAVEILKTASLLEHLTIEISVYGGRIDFSCLAALAESVSFRQIDIYIVDESETEVVSALGCCEGLKKLIERDVVIHAGAAPRLDF